MLLAIGFILLIASWIGANAPGEAPDEPANYVKAVGAGHGQFYGTATTLKNPSFPPAAGEAQRIAWIERNTRAFASRRDSTPNRSRVPTSSTA